MRRLLHLLCWLSGDVQTGFAVPSSTVSSAFLASNDKDYEIADKNDYKLNDKRFEQHSS